MRIHLIAVGGAIMHNLAIALKQLGHTVSGSDDEIFEPALSALKAEGLMPAELGWFKDRIHSNLDLVILGMHARKDNPELAEAQKLELSIQSFPQFMASHAGNKRRVVIAGSHGKTTTTAMVMHVLRNRNLDFDYMVGSRIAGFDNMVRLSNAPVMVLEGDEYLSSALDPRPKFMHYKPHYAAITGVAWDHINVFPTLDAYHQAFKDFIKSMPAGAFLAYCGTDKALENIVNEAGAKVQGQPYDALEYKDGGILYEDNIYPLKIFGRHNMQNLHAAMMLCGQLGISPVDFLQAMADFTGTARRMEIMAEQEGRLLVRDFAHAPSKVLATVNAMRERNPKGKILAVYELHTFSSLNKDFLPGYKGTLDAADEAVVYTDAHVFELKKMPELSDQAISEAFAHPKLKVLHDAEVLKTLIRERWESNSGGDVLLMSSGNLGGAFDISAYLNIPN